MPFGASRIALSWMLSTFPSPSQSTLGGTAYLRRHSPGSSDPHSPQAAHRSSHRRSPQRPTTPTPFHPSYLTPPAHHPPSPLNLNGCAIPIRGRARPPPYSTHSSNPRPEQRAVWRSPHPSRVRAGVLALSTFAAFRFSPVSPPALPPASERIANGYSQTFKGSSPASPGFLPIPVLLPTYRSEFFESQTIASLIAPPLETPLSLPF